MVDPNSGTATLYQVTAVLEAGLSSTLVEVQIDLDPGQYVVVVTSRHERGDTWQAFNLEVQP